MKRKIGSKIILIYYVYSSDKKRKIILFLNWIKSFEVYECCTNDESSKYFETRMTHSKTKFNKSDDQTNIDNIE